MENQNSNKSVQSHIKKYLLYLLLPFTLSGCKKDKNEPGGSIGQTKTIDWELFHQFDKNEFVRSFAISDNAQWLFYTDNDRKIYRVNKNTDEKKVLVDPNPYGASGMSFAHFINGKLYMLYEKNYRSYFAVSEDFGETITEYLVGTYTHFLAGQFTGAFVNVRVNRLFIMPDGGMVIPHIFRQPNNATTPSDDGLIAVSADGGKTWTRSESEYSFISARQGNRLFAPSGGWIGDFNLGNASKFFYSDDKGKTWHTSDLKYRPQAIDRENNLIAGGRYEIQKLKNGTWTLYQWDGLKPPFISVTDLSFFSQGGTTKKEMADIEFDSANNLYLLNGNTRVYKTRLE